ncbi:hypothetical protein IW262DRAFT_1459276 [Armillaria fumosa]|nr:hypothetical protein IW262DRAFT_1459276 [Armillaria fumosa]
MSVTLMCCTGTYNKDLALRFDNGPKAVAGIPRGLVGNAHMSTASQAATMEYVREVFDKSTPPRAAVGTDFILKEYMQGVPPHVHRVKVDVIPELNRSPLYLRESDNKKYVADKYLIEPFTGNRYWFSREEPVVGDRGPWPDMTTFLQATCRLALCRAEYQAASAASSCSLSSSLLSRTKPDDVPELRQFLHHYISTVPYLTPAATPYLMDPNLPPAMRYEGSLMPFPDNPFSPPDMPLDICPSSNNRLDWNGVSLNGTERWLASCYEMF